MPSPLSTADFAMTDKSADSVELFTPGRICLFGEHSDWAGTYRKFNSSIVPGRALCCGTQQGVFARARPHPSLLRVSSTGNDGSVTSFECEMHPPTLLARAQEGSFWSYACGVAYEISRALRRGRTGGGQLPHYAAHQEGTVLVSRMVRPAGTRLQSGVRAADDHTRRDGHRLQRRGAARRRQCGRLDQCCAFGSQLVSMTFNGDILETEAVQLTVPIYLLIIDLKKAKVSCTFIR